MMGMYEDLKKCSGNKYFSLTPILPYNRPYNFLPGQRGAGKSTGVAIYCLLDFLYNKRKWIYTRRTKDETELTCKGFFENAVKIVKENTKFKDISCIYQKGEYVVNGEKSGSIVPLSIQYKYKSGDFSDYGTIIFDEFLCDESQGQTYLGSSAHPEIECSAMLSLFGTVDRGIDKPYRNETRVFFLGNASSYARNPFFLQYGVYDELERNPDAKIIAPKGRPWLLQKARAAAVAHPEDSWQYQLSDERQKSYIFGDSGTDDKSFVVKEMPEACEPLCNLLIKNTPYVVLLTSGMERFYCKRGRDGYTRTISVDLLGHDGRRDFSMVRAWHSMPELAALSDAFAAGRCYFDSVKTKLDFLSYLNYI